MSLCHGLLLSRSRLTSETRVVVVPPDTRCSVVVVACRIRCTVCCRVVNDGLECRGRVDNFCRDARVGRGEVLQVACEQVVVLCNNSGFEGADIV